MYFTAFDSRFTNACFINPESHSMLNKFPILRDVLVDLLESTFERLQIPLITRQYVTPLAGFSLGDVD